MGVSLPENPTQSPHLSSPCPSPPPYPPPDPHAQALNERMISRIGRGLIQHTDRFAIESQPSAAEAQIGDDGVVVVAVGMVGLDKERDAGRAVPERAAERDLERGRVGGRRWGQGEGLGRG